jgi:RNA polymerase sigma-70 factor (ECF subfamily)
MENTNYQKIYQQEIVVHLKEIYRVALRMTRHQTDAEDLAQEALMQAWVSIEKYNPGTNGRAWLYTILFNKFKHYQRKQYRTSARFTEADEFVFNNAIHSPAIPEYLTDEEVIRALDELPEHYRSVVLLVDVHDFLYKEVADILEIPIGTIMSRLHRARAALKKMLVKNAAALGITKTKAFVMNPAYS